MADDYPPVPSIADVQASELLRTGFRAGPSINEVYQGLGLLAELQGSWRGSGFNITPRPFYGSNPPVFLELNATHETLDFNAISGCIPNRGSRQPDINLHGLRYLQQVTDVVTNSGIHIEPGLWLRVPATEVPEAGETYVRQATVPHGDALVAQSTFVGQGPGGPLINPVNSTPFTDAFLPGLNGQPNNPVTDPAFLAQYLDDPLPEHGMPPGLDPVSTIKDPTLVLKSRIARQTIVNTAVIAISTAAPTGGIVNIPFVAKNAKAAQMDAIFWIEKVQHPNGHHFMQLQYVQRVILDFIGIHWPHFSVATLVRI